MLNFKGATLKAIIWIVYGVTIGELIIINFVSEQTGDKFYIIYYIISTVILFTSALLYLPVMISIKKLTNLQSSHSSKPQKYVLWQLFVIVFEKLMYILPAYYDYDRSWYNEVFYCKLLDVLLMPVVIQVTYLGCNRRNLEALLESVKKKSRCRTYGWRLYRRAEVRPTAGVL